MVDASKLTLRQRFCRAEHCRTLFFICSRCDRGHAYCSQWCRQKSRRQQQREANRRHQQSAEGRLDHRDRQRLYRLRQNLLSQTHLSISVTDHGLTAAVISGNIARPPWALRLKAVGFKLSACRVCGRVGLVNLFSPD